eukprot:TRINITY_DN2621_c1_g2_i1.p1 TRINITY_DN2621_c1_g2~~TRINITY_DN2621_c1_g2_i1.p1  ORF type:complete len:220 (+),score=52.18 TRINITY_DN2621_c1_g2_i1:87-662(+)
MTMLYSQMMTAPHMNVIPPYVGSMYVVPPTQTQAQGVATGSVLGQKPQVVGNGRMWWPCQHNDWDDVRTRKGIKVLRCRVCHVVWKQRSSGAARCMAYLHGCCPYSSAECQLPHVHRRKKPKADFIEITPEQFQELQISRRSTSLPPSATHSLSSCDGASSGGSTATSDDHLGLCTQTGLMCVVEAKMLPK